MSRLIVSVRDGFPVKRTCNNPQCKNAVTVCMACLRRGCRHFFRDAGHVDVATMTDAGLGLPSSQITSPSSTLLSIGHCGCEPITRADGVTRVLSHIVNLKTA